MADETEHSIRSFQQLRNRQNDLYRKNTAAIVEASKNSDRDGLNKLRASRRQMAQNDNLIMQAELVFVNSNRAQSDAEKDLGEQTRRANLLVKQIKTAAQVLEAVGEFGKILKRVIDVFT